MISMVLASLSGELLKARRRPATWVLMGLLVFYLVFSNYLMQYGYYLDEKATGDVFTVPLELQILSLLPLQTIQNVLDEVSSVGLPIALILGALITGSEYGWGTWKSVLAQHPPRTAVLAGQVLAAGVILLAVVPALLVAATVSSTVIGLLEHKPLTYPPAIDLLETAGATFLMLFMPACMGIMLAVITRGTALAIGIGLGWLAVVEAVIEQFANTIPIFQAAQQWLPGANAISLSIMFGSVGGGINSDIIGPALGAPPKFALTLAAYIVVFLLVGFAVFRRRDVA